MRMIVEWSPLGQGSGAGQCMDTECVQPDSAHLTPIQPDTAHLTPLQPTPHLLPGELRLEKIFLLCCNTHGYSAVVRWQTYTDLRLIVPTLTDTRANMPKSARQPCVRVCVCVCVCVCV